MTKTVCKGGIESIVREDPVFNQFLGSKVFVREVIKNKVFSALVFKKGIEKDILYLATIELGDLSSSRVIEADDLNEDDWVFLSKENVDKNKVIFSKKKIEFYPRPSNKGEIATLDYHLITDLNEYLFFCKNISGNNWYI